MTKEMIDTVEEYVRSKFYESSNIESTKALLIIHNTIWKIKERMEDKPNGN